MIEITSLAQYADLYVRMVNQKNIFFDIVLIAFVVLVIVTVFYCIKKIMKVFCITIICIMLVIECVGAVGVSVATSNIGRLNNAYQDFCYNLDLDESGLVGSNTND